MTRHHSHHPADEPQGDDSQVRSIIRQLNEDVPGKETEREVVVRPDGSKVVRVTKKRRALISKEEKSRGSRRLFMQGLFALLLLVAGITGFFFYRMSVMSGERYLMNRSEELRQLWGASAVRCTGAVIDGVELHISNIVAEFPEDCMVQRVELSELEAEINLGTFFTGVIAGDNLKVGRAHIHLNPAARRLQLPQARGEELWRFMRVSCPDFTITFAGDGPSPWSLRHTNAYMYRPSSGSTLTVVTLEGGSMQMRGWKDVFIQDAKFHFSQLAIEDFTLSGTTDIGPAVTESSRTSITFTGSLAEGADFSGPYYFVADNMNFSDFTGGRFNSFFAARTIRPALRSGVPSTQVLLPFENISPQFSGTFSLKDVSLSGLPAMQYIVEHLEPAKRKRYLPPTILLATASLTHDGGAMTLSFDESGMTERDVITLRGTLRVDDVSELSGTVDYGIPALLTHVEYRDGKADPIFREDGQYAWVSTVVSGPATRPQDNAHELDGQAAAERATRERIPFDDIDLNRVNDYFRSREQLMKQGGESTPLTPDAGSPDSPAAPSSSDFGGDNRLSPGNPLDVQGGNPLDPQPHPLDSPF